MPAAARGLKATFDDKLDIVPDRAVKVRETHTHCAVRSRFRRRDLPFPPCCGRSPQASGETQMTWNARCSNSFSAHEHLNLPTA